MENFSEILNEVEKEQKIIYNNNKVTYREKGYFKNIYESEWMESSLAKEMIKDIDKSDVVSSECIVSPVLGQIPPERL